MLPEARVAIASIGVIADNNMTNHSSHVSAEKLAGPKKKILFFFPVGGEPSPTAISTACCSPSTVRDSLAFVSQFRDVMCAGALFDDRTEQERKDVLLYFCIMPTRTDTMMLHAASAPP